MKAVILAGGQGTRLSEETASIPKPMISIGGLPIIVHIMKIYSTHGINDFVICLGHLGYTIKEYFSHYFLHRSDVTFDLKLNTMEILNRHSEPWKVTLVDTGEDTYTGGRLKRVKHYLHGEDFCLTYGDGVSDVDITKVIALHKYTKPVATVTAVQPPGRFGALDIDGVVVKSFQEKPAGDGGWINAGFFVFSPEIFDYIEGDKTWLEQEPLKKLASMGQLIAYQHPGFFQPMDTLRDKQHLEALWKSGEAPWKVW